MLFLKHVLIGIAAAAWPAGVIISVLWYLTSEMNIHPTTFFLILLLIWFIMPMAIMFGWIFLKSREFKNS
ncbi:MAG: hypothetical protein CMK07_12300 [Ponticaulis sp.]|nr:hypothetical protein [Ponticaulis sp.]